MNASVVVGPVEEIPPGAAANHRAVPRPRRHRRLQRQRRSSTRCATSARTSRARSAPGDVCGRIVADAPPSGAAADRRRLRSSATARSSAAPGTSGSSRSRPAAAWSTHACASRPIRWSIEDGQVVVYADPADLPPQEPSDLDRSSSLLNNVGLRAVSRLEPRP